MSIISVMAGIALAGAIEGAPMERLFDSVADLPRVAGEPTGYCRRVRIIKPADRDKKNPFSCVLMPAEGFDATTRKYIEGLAPDGWRRVTGLSNPQLVVLQKRAGWRACRQLWIQVAPVFAPRGTDLTTVPAQMSFELHSGTHCLPVESAS